MLFRLKTVSLPPSAAECCSDCWVITPTLYSSAPSAISITSLLFLLLGEREWEPFDQKEREKERKRKKERQTEGQKERMTEFICGHPVGTTAAMCQPVVSDPDPFYSDQVRRVKYILQSYGSTERQKVKL